MSHIVERKQGKKFLFTISTLTGGGAERALCRLTCNFPADVTVDILVDYETKNDYLHKGNVISLNLSKGKKFFIMYQLFAMLKRYLFLKRLKATGEYTACISFKDSANIVNVLSGKKNCKVILSERINLSSCISSVYRYIVFPLAKLLYSRADNMVSVSKGVEIDLIKNFNLPKERAVTIYNGCDIGFIQASMKKPSNIMFDADRFYFISVGRLCEQKGQWHLLRAFCEVVKKHPESCLILCGEGSYLSMLQQMTLKYGLMDNVIFAGFQKNPFAITAKCDVFVFPSIYEGCGNAIIENMVCGLPVISTDHRSGAREILAPGTDFNFQLYDNVEYAEYGVLTPVCSRKKNKNSELLEKEELLLAEAMIKLIEDKELRDKYALKSIERAKDFSIENTVKQWLELL